MLDLAIDNLMEVSEESSGFYTMLKKLKEEEKTSKKTSKLSKLLK